MAEPSAYDQYMLELINTARANPTGTAANVGIGLNNGFPRGQYPALPRRRWLSIQT